MAVRDIVFGAIFIFIVGVTLLVSGYIGKTINQEIRTNDRLNSTEVVAGLDSADAALDKFDYIFFAFFIGFFLGIVITSWFVSANPVFMWIYFFILIFIVMISSILAQVWTEFATNAFFVLTLSDFPLTNHVLLNLPTYIAVIGLVGILVLFGKPYFTSEFK